MNTSANAPGEITRLLTELERGDPAAYDRLLPVVYEALKRIAHRQLRRHARNQTLCTTELVHETYLKLARHGPADWKNRAHFYAIAACAMRQLLVDHARRRGAAKRDGDRGLLTLAGQGVAHHTDLHEVLALDEALTRLDQMSARLRKVVEYRFFGGMTEEEIAAVLDVSTRTVERDWVKARLFLHRELYPEDA